jgi:hypothetical protein
MALAPALVALISTGWQDLHAQGMICETKGGTRTAELLESIKNLKVADRSLIVNAGTIFRVEDEFGNGIVTFAPLSISTPGGPIREAASGKVSSPAVS